MSIISEARAVFDEWMAAVTRTIDGRISRYARRPEIVLGAQGGDLIGARMKSTGKKPALSQVSFRLSHGRPNPPLPAEWRAAFRGSRVEMPLAPDQVLLRSLDFPKQAEGFLEGMIRTQIDRLTPWSSDDAVFGWSAPAMVANDRIELTLAATSRQEIQPLVQLASGLEAESLALSVTVPDQSGAPVKIRVLDQPLQSSGRRRFDTSRILRGVLASAGVAALACSLAALYVGGNLDSELEQLTNRIAERRAALRLGPAGSSALGILAQRKQTSPSTVVVLEALSQALPDGTYVTGLKVDGDKVQVIGMTQDAPPLIRLIEKSPQFARATFFAPTTRAANEPGERFHIEAHITPSFGSGT